MNTSGRLTSAVIVEFHDHADRVVHAQFQEWRRLHPNGLFLTFGAKRRARLHNALCPHSGNVYWGSEQADQSLTTRRKVCADTKESLLAWAADEGVEIARCADCFQRSSARMKTPSGALTAFSWGYWGWGNSVPEFLEAAAALESARGFGPPAFADVRLR